MSIINDLKDLEIQIEDSLEKLQGLGLSTDYIRYECRSKNAALLKLAQASSIVRGIWKDRKNEDN